MILIPVIVLAQSAFSYSDSKGDLTLRAKDGQGQSTATGLKLDLQGSVFIASKKRKVTLGASTVSAILVSSKGSDSPDELKTATAKGAVKLTQNAQGRLANLQANSATYTSQGAGASVQANGAVRIQNIDERKRETMIATGSSGTAVLNPNSKRGIDRATLNGPVRVEMVQSQREGARVVFTGRKLTLNGNVVTLTGNVNATGNAASRLGKFSNVDSVVVTLNDKGEMSQFTFQSGGQG